MNDMNLAQRVSQHDDKLRTITLQIRQKELEKGCMEGRQEGKMEVARTCCRRESY